MLCSSFRIIVERSCCVDSGALAQLRVAVRDVTSVNVRFLSENGPQTDGHVRAPTDRERSNTNTTTMNEMMFILLFMCVSNDE